MKERQLHTMGQAVSSLLMILTLLWLCLSTPFVYAAEQASKKTMNHINWQADDNNPFSNTTEEKNESSAASLSEYLHDQVMDEHNFIVLGKYYKCHPSDLYFEFHPELVSPPPEA